MKLIDTHSHLYDEVFSKDIDHVIERLEDQHIYTVLLPNVDSATIDQMHSLQDKRPDLFQVMMGLHPTSVKDNYGEELEIINQWLSKKVYCAVGEIGIDLYWDKAYLAEQIVVFETQIDWAIEKNMPIVIHCRESFDTICECLKKFPKKKLRGVFHSFTGNKDVAEKIFSLGDFKLGINGIVTFKNSGLDNIMKQIPLQKIVLETDSPYLAPAPYRGKRNESAYLSLIAQKLAEINNTGIDEVARITTANAEEIFFYKTL